MEKSAAQDMKSLLVTNGMTSRAAGRVVEILEPMGYFEIPASMTYHGAWMMQGSKRRRMRRAGPA